MRLYANVDGSTEFRNPSKRGSAAWILYKDDVEIARGVTVYEGERVSNNEMELNSILNLLKHTNQMEEMSFKVIEIRSDSKLAVEILNRNWVCKASNLQPIVKDIWELCDKIDAEIVFAWLPREKNRLADALSKSAWK